MTSYEDIPLWENASRCRALMEFRENVISYFNNSSPVRMGGDRIEKPEAVRARHRINLTTINVRRIIVAAGIAPIMMWSPPPMIGGHVQKIDLIFNVFKLDRYQISGRHAVGFIEMALGVYQSDRTAALRRTINPLWWLFRGLLWCTRLPFVVLGAVGFDAPRAERSVLGRLVKLVAALLTATAALLTIVNLLGWLPGAKALLGIK